jgi:hypothetical protein
MFEESKTEVMDKEMDLGELVLQTESKLKDFGFVGLVSWNRWKGNDRYEIFYSPESVEFEFDEEDNYFPLPEVWYLLYDKLREEVIHVGNFLTGFEQGMSGYYDEKLTDESQVIDNFTKYITEKYGREMKN